MFTVGRVRARSIGAVLGALLAVGAVAGCSGSSGQGAGTSSATASGTSTMSSPGSAGTSATSKATGGSTQKGTVTPGPSNNLTLRKQVTMTSCSGDTHGWAASGTIKNPASSGHTYSITVYFTTDKATDVGQGRTSVFVGAGESKPWKVKGTFTGQKKVLCVLGPVT